MRVLLFAIAVVATIFGVAAVLTASPGRAASACGDLGRVRSVLAMTTDACGILAAHP